MQELTTETALVKSAVGHLQTVLRENPAALGLGFVGAAWRYLPGDEAASIERACDFASGRCAHGFISRCEEPECRAQVRAIYESWNAEAEQDYAEDRDLESA